MSTIRSDSHAAEYGWEQTRLGAAVLSAPSAMWASGLSWSLGLAGQEAVAVDDRGGEVDELAVIDTG
jgi:hypothetical protein